MNNTSRTTPVTATALRSTSGVQTSSAVVLMGVMVGDASHGQVHIHLHNGDANNDPIVAMVHPANANHDTIWFGPNGIACPDGVYLDVITGTPLGSVLTLPIIK